MKHYFLFLIVFLGFNFNANAQQAGTLYTQFSQDGWDKSIFCNNNGFKITKTIDIILKKLKVLESKK